MIGVQLDKHWTPEQYKSWANSRSVGVQFITPEEKNGLWVDGKCVFVVVVDNECVEVIAALPSNQWSLLPPRTTRQKCMMFIKSYLFYLRYLIRGLFE